MAPARAIFILKWVDSTSMFQLQVFVNRQMDVPETEWSVSQSASLLATTSCESDAHLLLSCAGKGKLAKSEVVSLCENDDDLNVKVLSTDTEY